MHSHHLTAIQLSYYCSTTHLQHGCPRQCQGQDPVQAAQDWTTAGADRHLPTGEVRAERRRGQPGPEDTRKRAADQPVGVRHPGAGRHQAQGRGL